MSSTKLKIQYTVARISPEFMCVCVCVCLQNDLLPAYLPCKKSEANTVWLVLCEPMLASSDQCLLFQDQLYMCLIIWESVQEWYQAHQLTTIIFSLYLFSNIVHFQHFCCQQLKTLLHTGVHKKKGLLNFLFKNHHEFLSYDKCTMLCKRLTLEETVWKIHGNSIFAFLL